MMISCSHREKLEVAELLLLQRRDKRSAIDTLQHMLEIRRAQSKKTIADQGVGQVEQSSTPRDALLKEFSEVLEKISSVVGRPTMSRIPTSSEVKELVFSAVATPMQSKGRDKEMRSSPKETSHNPEDTQDVIKTDRLLRKENTSSEANSEEEHGEEPVVSNEASNTPADTQTSIQGVSAQVAPSLQVQSEQSNTSDQMMQEELGDPTQPSKQETSPTSKDVLRSKERAHEHATSQNSEGEQEDGEAQEYQDEIVVQKPQERTSQEPSSPRATERTQEEGKNSIKNSEESAQLIQAAAQMISAMMHGVGGSEGLKVQNGVVKSALEQGVLKIAEGRPMSSTSSYSGEGISSRIAREGRRDDRTERSALRTQVTQQMDKVEQALKEAAKSRDGKTISVRLDPPDLGSVKIDVTLRDGGLHARLVGESSSVVSVLKEHASDLQVVLRKLGLNVDTVTVAVSSEERMYGGDSSNLFQDRQPSLSQERQSGEQDRGVHQESILASPAVSDVGIEDHWVA